MAAKKLEPFTHVSQNEFYWLIFVPNSHSNLSTDKIIITERDVDHKQTAFMS